MHKKTFPEATHDNVICVGLTGKFGRAQVISPSEVYCQIIKE